EERADRLRGRGREAGHQSSSSGVAAGPPSTMSKRKPSAHSGDVVSQSKREIIRSRADASRTELKMGSYGNSGSPGKYIWVTRRWAKERPNSERWMCAGRQAFGWLRHGYAPGLTVTKW